MTRQPAKPSIPIERSPTARPGFWAMRMVKGGPEVGARIAWERTTFEPGEPENRMDRSPILTARLNGKIVPLDRVWLTKGRVITEAEYEFLIADRAWAKVHAPDEPAANPMEPVDRRRIPIPFLEDAPDAR